MNKRLHEAFDHVNDYDFSRQLKLHMIYYACNCIGQAASLTRKEAISEIRAILRSNELEAAFSEFPFPEVNGKLKLQLWLMENRCENVLWLLGLRRSKR